MDYHHSDLSPFVGRKDELARIHTLLSDPACRLLTLVGPGGIGKTRLAIEAAQRLSDGLHFISFQPLTSPDFLVSAIADALNFQFYPGNEPKQQLLDYLHKRSGLLVLDNFEHLLDGATLISEILACAPTIRLLITSRERLNLFEEWVLEVDGLAYPSSDRDADAEQFSAVALFMQHARRVKSEFILTEKTAPAVVRICRLVGGMPLGILLAASWVRALSCDAIADEIEHSLDILETPARNVESRHRTMKATFEPTWTRLSDKEQEVFRKLSVFRGGFTREAAKQVAGASLRTLSTLVDKSLLRVNTNGRYDVHELLRQYGEERLNESPEETIQVYDLHYRYYANFLSLRKDELVHGNPKPAAAEVDPELENIRSAWNRMVEGEKAELIEQALISLYGYYALRGLYQECVTVFGKTAERFRLQSNLAFALAVSHQAWCVQYLGDFETAGELYQQGLAAFRRLGVATQTAYCLERLSEVARIAKDYDAAYHYIEEARSVIDEAGENERWRLAFTFALFGQIAFLTGDLLEAKRWYEEALAMSQTYHVQIGVANALYYLGNVELALKAYPNAEHAYQACLKHSQNIDLEMGCIDALAGLGETALRRQAYSEVKHYSIEALQLSKQRMLIYVPVLRTFLNIAELFIERGQHEQAIALIAVSLYHPVSEEHIRERARTLIPQLQAEIHPDIFAPAWEHARKAEVSTLIDDLLETLQQPSAFPDTRSADIRANPLSSRELDVLRLIAEGCSNQDIADRLCIGVSTVKKHINHIYDKLSVKNRTRAVARARELRYFT